MKRDYCLLFLDAIITVGVFVFTDYVVENNLLYDRFYLFLFEIAWAFLGWSCYWLYTLNNKYKNAKNKTDGTVTK